MLGDGVDAATLVATLGAGPPPPFSLFGEYTYLEYVRIHIIYRAKQAECVIYMFGFRVKG